MVLGDEQQVVVNEKNEKEEEEKGNKNKLNKNRTELN